MIKRIKELTSQKVNYELTTAPGDGITIAERALKQGFKKLIAVGGDGTINEVANAIIHHARGDEKVKLGILPLGSSNDHCKNLWIPQRSKNLDLQLKILFEGYTVKLPAGIARGDTTRYFTEMADTGFAGVTAMAAHTEAKWLKGEMKYNYLLLKKLITYKNVPGTISIDDKEEIDIKITSLFVCMSEIIVGYKICPGQDFTKDHFGVLYTNDISKLELLKLIWKARTGNHVDNKKVFLEYGRKVHVTMDTPLPWELEGEIFSHESREVTLEFLPLMLPTIVPKEYYEHVKNQGKAEMLVKESISLTT